MRHAASFHFEKGCFKSKSVRLEKIISKWHVPSGRIYLFFRKLRDLVKMLTVTIRGLIQSEESGVPSVILTSSDDVLLISIGVAEAASIQMALEGKKLPRPMTHDLIENLLSGLHATLRSVTIYKIQNSTFYAYLSVEQRNDQDDVIQELRIDARPSDGIAIAVRVGCPVYVAEDVMKQAGLRADFFFGQLDLNQKVEEENNIFFIEDFDLDMFDDDEDDDDEDDDEGGFR